MVVDFSFSHHTVGFIIDGVFDLEASKTLHTKIEEKINGFDKINLYIEDNNLEKITLPAVYDDCKFKIENSDKFNKIAMVTDRLWLKACMSIKNATSRTNVKWFATEDRMKAMDWIAED